MKTCFSEGKRTKQFGTPSPTPVFKRTPIAIKPLISEQFFHDLPICPKF